MIFPVLVVQLTLASSSEFAIAVDSINFSLFFKGGVMPPLDGMNMQAPKGAGHSDLTREECQGQGKSRH
jgi:hypothetical protein